MPAPNFITINKVFEATDNRAILTFLFILDLFFQIAKIKTNPESIQKKLLPVITEGEVVKREVVKRDPPAGGYEKKGAMHGIRETRYHKVITPEIVFTISLRALFKLHKRSFHFHALRSFHFSRPPTGGSQLFMAH